MTPEQMRALADMDPTDDDALLSPREWIMAARSGLRLAADQLEAVQTWRDKFNSHPVSFADLDAILTAGTAPQEDRDE